MGFTVNKVGIERIFLRVLRFSSVSIIPPVLQIFSLIRKRRYLRCMISAAESVTK